MPQSTVNRRLSAILAADVVGYSRLMSEDGTGTLKRLKSIRKELVQPEITGFNGRIVKLMGDGLLAEYPSVIEAVQCAVNIQQSINVREIDLEDDRRIRLRIGINMGDIIVEGSDIYGDGVNIAARLESLADTGGICISSAVRSAIGNKLPFGYEFMGEQNLKNIAQPVRAYRVLLGEKSINTTDSSKNPALDVYEKPSIAVLPFTNMSDDPGQEYFADGISEDIISGLSRFHWFFVIDRNSSFSYKGSAVNVKQISRELGVQYILEGSVRKSGNRVRISTQLIDAACGRHIWAERYDRELEDIFTVQDEVSEAITTAVAPAFVAAEAKRAKRKAPESLDAWEYAMRGNWHLTRRGKDDLKVARQLFETALQIDSRSTMALSGLAFTLCWVNLFGWEDDLEVVRKRSYEVARHAVDLDDDDAWAHTMLGWVHFSLHDLDTSVSECQRALEINPSLALAESVLSISYSWRGDNDDALRCAEKAERLSPRNPAQSMWSFARSSAEFGVENYEQAVVWAKLATEVMPEFPGAWRYLASSLGHLGKSEEARAATNQLLQVMPNDNLRMVRAALPGVRAERLERFVDGLRKAGLPE